MHVGFAIEVTLVGCVVQLVYHTSLLAPQEALLHAAAAS